MIPRLTIHRYTTSAADDANLDGPEYAGRQIALTWLGFTIEISFTRKRGQ